MLLLLPVVLLCRPAQPAASLLQLLRLAPGAAATNAAASGCSACLGSGPVLLLLLLLLLAALLLLLLLLLGAGLVRGGASISAHRAVPGACRNADRCLLRCPQSVHMPRWQKCSGRPASTAAHRTPHASATGRRQLLACTPEGTSRRPQQRGWQTAGQPSQQSSCPWSDPHAAQWSLCLSGPSLPSSDSAEASSTSRQWGSMASLAVEQEPATAGPVDRTRHLPRTLHAVLSSASGTEQYKIGQQQWGPPFARKESDRS